MTIVLDPVDGIRVAIADVPDPEIPAITLADLGIIRDIRRRDDGRYEVLLTPTYTGCPATLVIETSVRIALDRAGFGAVGIRSVLSPPWATDWITDAGRDKLHAYGIAPPARGAARSRTKGRRPVRNADRPIPPRSAASVRRTARRCGAARTAPSRSTGSNAFRMRRDDDQT